MKRPQGFDRSRQPRAVQRRQGTAAPSAAPREEDTHRSAESGLSPTDTAPAAPVVQLTQPLPFTRGSEGTGAADTGADAGSVGARLRRARRERKRFERGEVRRFTKRARHRRILWLSSLGAVAVLVLGVVLVSLSPFMALRTIEVRGTDRVDAAAVRKALDSQLGRPMPLLDTGAITSALAGFPLIRSYTTEVHPPGTLLVRIVERTPIGVVKTGAQYTVVDPAGVAISRFPDRPAGYPLITPPEGSSGFSAVVSVLQALPKPVLSKVDTATATTKDDVSFTLLANGATVVWGSRADSSLKSTILADLLAVAPTAHTYDVSSPSNAVTR